MPAKRLLAATKFDRAYPCMNVIRWQESLDSQSRIKQTRLFTGRALLAVDHLLPTVNCKSSHVSGGSSMR